jgi:hypothetical protein
MTQDRTNAQVEGFDVDFEKEFSPEEIARADREAEAALDAMGNFLLEDDPAYGSERVVWDEGENKLHIVRSQDVESTVEWCKGRYNEGIVNRHSEFRQFASLPPNALAIWGAANYPGLPDVWWELKQYHNLVLKAAHSRDLGYFRTLAGNYIRRQDAA